MLRWTLMTQFFSSGVRVNILGPCLSAMRSTTRRSGLGFPSVTEPRGPDCVAASSGSGRTLGMRSSSLIAFGAFGFDLRTGKNGQSTSRRSAWSSHFSSGEPFPWSPLFFNINIFESTSNANISTEWCISWGEFEVGTNHSIHPPAQY